MNSQALVQIQNLNLILQNKTILQNVSFDILPNEIITLIGPNGAGKSSLVKLILGITRATSGTIVKSHNLSVGYVPQAFHIDDRLPINVAGFILLNQTKTDKLDETLQLLNIAHLKDQKIQGLSGGQLQRVLLARAILSRPQLLILDEPAQGIDFHGEAELYALIHQIQKELKCAVLMISHDLHVVMAQTSQVICLNQHICCFGEPESISKHPEFINIFGDKIAKNVGYYQHDHDHDHALDGQVKACTHDHNHSIHQHNHSNNSEQP
ncbi:ATP-binding cassette domain-containing protein [Marinicellulosiphila megalodicopiae]|uniref:ATP-binding cassette domain-containing protein n=1 Tax=Marinicellulosiphila megalodicopiae TaxID=2724896 RepID=UPI003BB20AB9